MRAVGKDIGAGLVFAFVGILYGLMTWFNLPIGSALRMGPGYFPIVLSAALVICGAVIVVRGFIDLEDREPFGQVPWRGIFLLSMATIIFASCVERLGLFPGVFATAFVATLANPKVKILTSIVSSLGIALFCTAVFGFGIKLPLPLVGNWLTW